MSYKSDGILHYLYAHRASEEEDENDQGQDETG
jgi:hypothetical protein